MLDAEIIVQTLLHFVQEAVVYQVRSRDQMDGQGALIFVLSGSPVQESQ